jgi:hypothetical protein
VDIFDQVLERYNQAPAVCLDILGYFCQHKPQLTWIIVTKTIEIWRECVASRVNFCDVVPLVPLDRFMDGSVETREGKINNHSTVSFIYKPVKQVKQTLEDLKEMLRTEDAAQDAPNFKFLYVQIYTCIDYVKDLQYTQS